MFTYIFNGHQIEQFCVQHPVTSSIIYQILSLRIIWETGLSNTRKYRLIFVTLRIRLLRYICFPRSCHKISYLKKLRHFTFKAILFFFFFCLFNVLSMVTIIIFCARDFPNTSYIWCMNGIGIQYQNKKAYISEIQTLTVLHNTHNKGL